MIDAGRIPDWRYVKGPAWTGTFQSIFSRWQSRHASTQLFCTPLQDSGQLIGHQRFNICQLPMVPLKSSLSSSPAGAGAIESAGKDQYHHYIPRFIF
jgi:hypothetical protein